MFIYITQKEHQADCISNTNAGIFNNRRGGAFDDMLCIYINLTFTIPFCILLLRRLSKGNCVFVF